MRKDYLPYTILTLLGLILNAFTCSMSPFRECLFNSDVNCFYMEGKAWALGYIPYVDFIDSKGPLLFLIFAIGYLISPDNTYGMYLLASVSTVITLIFIYKTAHHFTKSISLALFVTICCSAALFFKPYYGYGPRTEQFIIPFVAWIIYFITAKADKLDKDIKNWTYLGICLGITTAICLLTKYVYIIFPLVTFICAIVFLNNNHSSYKNLLLLSTSFLFSLFLFCLPFAIYLFLTKSFDDFIWSYFQLSANYSTHEVQSSLFEKLLSYFSILKNNTIKEPAFFAVLISLITFGLPVFREQMNMRHRLACIISFLALIFCCSIGLFRYYLLVYFPLFMFPIIVICLKFSSKKLLFISLSLFILFFSILTPIIATKYKLAKQLSNTPKEWSCDYKKVEDIIKSRFRAKIIYMDGLGHGFGIRTGAIPACPAWFKLTKSGSELAVIQETAIIKRIPDFVFTHHYTNYSDLLKNSGYEKTMTILEGSRMKTGLTLWSKKNSSPHQ